MEKKNIKEPLRALDELSFSLAPYILTFEAFDLCAIFQLGNNLVFVFQELSHEAKELWKC